MIVCFVFFVTCLIKEYIPISYIVKCIHLLYVHVIFIDFSYICHYILFIFIFIIFLDIDASEKKALAYVTTNYDCFPYLKKNTLFLTMLKKINLTNFRKYALQDFKLG